MQIKKKLKQTKISMLYFRASVNIIFSDRSIIFLHLLASFWMTKAEIFIIFFISLVIKGVRKLDAIYSLLGRIAYTSWSQEKETKKSTKINWKKSYKWH